jgi:hypothetical protein
MMTFLHLACPVAAIVGAVVYVIAVIKIRQIRQIRGGAK